MKFPERVHEAHAHDLLESLAAHRARIHPQRPADISRDALEPLEAADLRVARGDGEIALPHADACADVRAVDFEPLEFAAGKMCDHPANAAVAHEEIRAAAHDEKRNRALRREAHEPREALFGLRLHPELRRPADAHRRVFRERFVESRDAGSHHVQDIVEHRRVPREHAALLVDVARAEGKNEVAGFHHPADVERDFLPHRLEAYAFLRSLLRDCIRDCLPAHAGNRQLACGINVRQHEHIRVLKRPAKIIPQRLRARVAMRLEHREDAFPSRAARGRERRADLARVMPVVVHDHEALGAVLDLEAPPRAAERFERLRDF